MLIIAATPIGNLQDASARLQQQLGAADYIACEDTRVLGMLAKGLGVQLKAKLISLHEHNEAERLAGLVELARDSDLLLVSDAGMPTVSDPGFQLVRAASEAGVEIICLPGPSATLAALAVSGLPTDRFCFEGFLPRKQGERVAMFEELLGERRTMVFFESPHRILESLQDAASVLGEDRRASVSRELTKKFEHTERGTLGELIAWAESEPKGEMVLVIAGAKPRQFDIAQLAQLAMGQVSQGVRLKQACGDIAKQFGASSSEIYAEALKLKP